MKVEYIPCTLWGLFDPSWYIVCCEMHKGRHHIANNLRNSEGEAGKKAVNWPKWEKSDSKQEEGTDFEEWVGLWIVFYS